MRGGATRQPRARAARHHRYSALAAGDQHRLDFLLGARQGDEPRQLAKHGETVAFVRPPFLLADQQAVGRQHCAQGGDDVGILHGPILTRRRRLRTGTGAAAAGRFCYASPPAGRQSKEFIFMRKRYGFGGVATACLGLAAAQTPPMQPDIPKFTAPTAEFDYIRREEMIPMRDGVKLFTVILIPKDAKNAPMLLTRTPYHAANRAKRLVSPHMLSSLPMGDEVLVPEGYIRVFQDVRGKYDSEGDYIMTRPLRGPLNATAVDHATDAYDTIDWLVKNVPQSNGKVGMIGSSYEGFTVLMALIHPHPALKAAAPMSPMVDGWKGDDWFHNGAFRQTNFDYLYGQTTARAEGVEIAGGVYDDYQLFLQSGSAQDFAR